MKKQQKNHPFSKMEVPPNHLKKERFLCTSNIPWTTFACQWIWKKIFQGNHLARVVNAAVEGLDDTIFDAAYPGWWPRQLHPKMLTKVIIYAYTQRIYPSRQIAKAVRENIPFMWLAGRQRPDFRTLNRFRSQRLRSVLETVFTAVLQFLADEKHMSLEHYFVDGTKMEANANRYTFVWGPVETGIQCANRDRKPIYFSLQKRNNSSENSQRRSLRMQVTAARKTTPIWKRKRFRRAYDETKDHWTCLAGQTLHFRKESTEILASGHREVVVSLERLRYQKQAQERLQSEEGYLWAVYGTAPFV
ncbi:transposase [Paenibacillus sp. PK3_47]|uniref:transposase n=1 Tax=Paenibacillus sp. PK3_47 TaxID=2072642 RepID=UPI00201E571A|nr:transposase [Paenibacillus sp. PK3_47]